MIFRRKLYEQMLLWKNKRNGSSALLVKGARRVGKSTLVEDFAKKEYDSYILIDFSQTSKKIDALFEDMMNLNAFFFQLQNIFETKLIERKSVIIFDEVQRQPLARQAIKHLVKDGRYDYIETGSLLSIKKNIANIVIPSEETRLTLYPMDYEEFRWALGDDSTADFMRESFEAKRPAGDALHRKWMRDLRMYMLIGGMPQAVETYLNTNNLQDVDEKKREILELYEDDFNRIDGTGRAAALFTAIPGQLSNNTGRFQVGTVIENQDYVRINSVVADMADSMVVNLAYHTNDPKVGMTLNKDMYRYKIYLGDTGLFVTLAFRDKLYTENLVYQKLLNDKLDTNLGYVYENLVAQMLRAAGNELYYYTFPDGNNHNYEVDFIISKGSKIIPLEVKSSGYKTHKSLDAFCEKFSSRIIEKKLIYTKDFRKENNLDYLPVYYTWLL